MKSILTNEQISEYKEAFSFFDKNNNGYFMISDLQEIMASLGMQITDNELLDIIDEIKTEKIDFKTFTSILVARVFQEKEETCAVFNLIDKVNRFFHLFFNCMTCSSQSFTNPLFCKFSTLQLCILNSHLEPLNLKS